MQLGYRRTPRETFRAIYEQTKIYGWLETVRTIRAEEKFDIAKPIKYSREDLVLEVWLRIVWNRDF